MSPRGDDVRRKYEDAVRLHRASEDEARLAHALRHLGEVHTENGRLGLAETCMTEAMTLYRAMSDVHPVALANAVRPLALLREAQGRKEEARAAWIEARELYEQCGITAGVEECDAHLGVEYGRGNGGEP